MMIVAATTRRKGLLAIRNNIVGKSSLERNHYYAVLRDLTRLSASRIRCIASSSSSQQCSSSSSSSLVTANSGGRLPQQASFITDEKMKLNNSFSQNSSSLQHPQQQQQQTRVYHEEALSPSRQRQLKLKLKVPNKKGIIRAKSSASSTAAAAAALPSSYSSSTSSTKTTYNEDGNTSTAEAAEPFSTTKQKGISLQRQYLDPMLAPVTVFDDFDDELITTTTTTTTDNADDDQDNEIDVVVDSPRISIVEAFYAAKTIDLTSLILSDFSNNTVRRKYQKDSLLIELSPSSAAAAGGAGGGSNHNNYDSTEPSYVAVYRFGSIIFFNVNSRLKTRLLKAAKRFATDPAVTGIEKRDSFGVCVNPEAERTRVTSDHCIVQQLDMNAVSVISEVMAQSVALDAYNEIVDSLLENFATINNNISTTNKMDLDKKMLFSKIAQNNRIFIDLISKLRIKARSQIAWDKGEYEVIHSGMQNEFDIDDRFELIQFKLDLIQQNSKLFLEVIHNQKAASVEWVIVVLIGFECVLMCLDMSGQGSLIFEYCRNMIS